MGKVACQALFCLIKAEFFYTLGVEVSNMTVGERIKNIRLSKGMTLEEVGARVGVLKTTINKYESGSISRIPYDRILLLAKAMNVDPSEFFADAEPQVKPTTEELEIVKALREHPEYKGAIQAMLGLK